MLFLRRFFSQVIGLALPAPDGSSMRPLYRGSSPRRDREVNMEYSDRRAAERVARALLALELPKPIFRRLHHRTTLRETEGVAEHLRWLRGHDAALTGNQKVLAHRLHACLEAWFESGSWNAAAPKALDMVPKE